MKYLIVIDTWKPHINGVITTYLNLIEELEKRGEECIVLSPNDFKSFPLPNYKEIRLALPPYNISKKIKQINPDVIHIATEGPLGIRARRFCDRNKIHYTTAFHTKFPDYIHKRIKLPKSIPHKWLKNFHKNSQKVLVSSKNIKEELDEIGYKNIVVWNRGIDTRSFFPKLKTNLNYEKPIYLYVGRIAKEKSIEDFLQLNLEGTKIVVGDGPMKNYLEKKYSNVKFVGYKKGKELGKYYASADVFVFPSKTDTLGLVLMESIATGTPVAAYPVTGPKDVVTQGVNGCLDDDLKIACLNALKLNREKCYESSFKWSWSNSADEFVNYNVKINNI